MTINNIPIRVPALAMIIFLFVIGCSKHAPAPPPPKPAPQVLIEPKAGVDGVKKGMNEEQVEAVLGEPEKKNGNAWFYLQKGMYVSFGGNGMMFNIKCVSPFAGVTKEGIGIGSTKGDLMTAYGAPSEDKPFKHGDEDLWFASLETSFYVQDGKVTSFIVHLNAP